MGAFLYGIEPHDLTTFTAGPCVLLAVAALACWLLARRPVRVSPLVALRTE